MANSQLYQFLKDKGLRPREAARLVGISYQYMIELLNGTTDMTDSARLKIARAFPETALWILQLELPMVQEAK